MTQGRRGARTPAIAPPANPAICAAMLLDFETLRGIAIAAVALAALAWLADRRRMRRRDPDAVGWMPWTAVFFWALVVACVAGGLAVQAWIME